MSAAVRPYGDAAGDGRVQLSFTLPLACSDGARRTALRLCRHMGFQQAQVTHMKPLGSDFTFFIVYGVTEAAVEPVEPAVGEEEVPPLGPEEVDDLIRERLGRRLVVVGACTGTDAHTVGLDAILSLKGYAGDHGLEQFAQMRVINLGSQVAPGEVVEAVRRERADAVLISQVVTQRDAHLVHLREVRRALEAAGLRERVLLVGGGPRLSPEQAGELGYDRIFGRGTRPGEVAAYLAWTVAGS